VAIFYYRLMAERPSPRRAQGLSSSQSGGGGKPGSTPKIVRGIASNIAPTVAGPPPGFAMTAATGFVSRRAGGRPPWAVRGALAIVVALIAATLALVFDLGRAPRTGTPAVGVSLPLPAELASPAKPPEPAGPASATAPPDDQHAAAEWYLARATGGDPTAQYETAVRYARGRGVAKDYARAASWFREAAINGIAAAQYDLGILYDKGLGVARDPIEAMIWYQSAADQNEPIAQWRLGTIYLAGGPPEKGGVPRNPAEAVRWLLRAAEQGVAEAQALLAARYETGDGTAPSKSRAYGWYSLAAESGLDDAQGAKKRLAEAFTPEEREDAERAAAALAAQVPQHMTVATRQGAAGLLLAALPAASPVNKAAGDSSGSGSPAGLSRGAISEIQRLLGAAGYDTGPADGFPGDQTVAAITRYQQDVGLPPDGTPSLALLNRLRAAAAGPPPAARPPATAKPLATAQP
jgi:localization factor PodJL